VLLANARDVARKSVLQRRGQHRHSVLAALAVADHDLVLREVDVLDAVSAALEQPEPGAVEQNRHEPRDPVDPAQDSADFLDRQDDGEAPRQVDAEDVTVEDKHSAQGLVLGRRSDPLVDCEGSQERRDLRRAHIEAVAFSVEEDLGATAVVARAERLAEPLEELRRARAGRSSLASAAPRVGRRLRRGGIRHAWTGRDGRHRASYRCGEPRIAPASPGGEPEIQRIETDTGACRRRRHRDLRGHDHAHVSRGPPVGGSSDVARTASSGPVTDPCPPSAPRADSRRPARRTGRRAPR
jgi:hypothetical protein